MDVVQRVGNSDSDWWSSTHIHSMPFVVSALREVIGFGLITLINSTEENVQLRLSHVYSS